MTPFARRGSVLASAIVMIGVIMAVAVGMMAYFDAANRRARAEKWGAIADDAARTGLSMMLGWAHASVDKYRTTPPEWDVGDGVIIDPLFAMKDSFITSQVWPAGAPTPKTIAGAGTYSVPPRPGDIIAQFYPSKKNKPTNPPLKAGEYVVGVYGQYVASFEVRLQSFSVSDRAAHMYKIAVAGRVRQLTGDPANPRLVADRVQLATIGRLPLSRYAALIDVDMVRNWVPGELVEGPVHINRGYVDAQPPFQPAGVSTTVGRSQMRLHCPGNFQPNGGNEPTFTDVVSMTRSDKPPYPDTANNSNFMIINATGTDETLDGPSYTQGLASKIFQAPDNQALYAGKAAPEFLTDPVALPVNSRGRLPTALGLPQGVQLTDLAWFQTLDDGVYVPSTDMVSNKAADYGSASPTVGGGIYVRGTVEVMRMWTDAANTYYLFQLGNLQPGTSHRCYMVRADRANKKVRLIAFNPGKTLHELAGGPTFDCAAAAADGASAPQTALGAFKLAMPPGSGAVRVDLAGQGDSPFNGVVFVDYAKNDPFRTAPGSSTLHAPTDHITPLSGHILALGDPGSTTGAGDPTAKLKLLPASAGLPAAFAGADICSTEDPATKRARRLTIIASGSIFIQNHLLVDSIVHTIDASDVVKNLRRDNVPLSATQDLLGLVADRQIVVGMCAPSAAVRSAPGVVITASMAALGDPAFNYATGATDPIPGGGPGNQKYDFYALRGSFMVESVIHLRDPGERESYDIGIPDASYNYLPANVYARPYPTNPLYDGNGTNWGFANLLPELNNPNYPPNTRGRLIFFGSLTAKKRGIIGVGDASYDKDFRYDQRLLSIAPPLFPNSVNLATFLSKVTTAGFPPYEGTSMDAELQMLN